MKITDPEVIRNGEKDLIDSVRDDLDLVAVRQILKDRMAATKLSSRGGQIVVHNNEIAFRLDFDIQMSGSLLFDRDGNYIPEQGEGGAPAPDGAGSEALIYQESVEEDDLSLEDLEQAKAELASEDLDAPAPDDVSDATSEQDDLEVSLPDYDLDDELDDGLSLVDEDTTDTGDGLSLDEDDAVPADGFSLEDKGAADPDDGLSLDDADADLSDFKVDEPDPMLDDPDDDMLGEDMLDDDINDILKESREFWEQKKDS